MPPKINRRSFLKGIGACLALCYVNPVALVPDLPIGNQFVRPEDIAAEVLTYFEKDLVFTNTFCAEKYVEPAMRKLAENMDNNIIKIIRREDYGCTTT